MLFLTTNAISALDPALIRAGRVDLFIEYKLATQAQAEQLFEIFYTPSQAIISEDILETSNKKGKQKKVSAESPETKPQPFDLPEDITKEDISIWARSWAGHLPEETFSIAELQGMLLAYKKDPQGASLAMPNWVEKEIQRKKQEEEDKEKARKEQEEEDKKAEQEEKEKKDSQVAAAPASAAQKAALLKAVLEAKGNSAVASTSGSSQTVATNGPAAVNGIHHGQQNGESSAVLTASPAATNTASISPITDGQEAHGTINGLPKGKEPKPTTNGSDEAAEMVAAAPVEETASALTASDTEK